MDSNIFQERSTENKNVNFQSLCEGARDHIKNAIHSREIKDTISAESFIREAVKLINTMKENSDGRESPDGEGNLSNLFTYMIDRLSIKYHTSGINPLDEVNWLLDSLKYIFRTHDHGVKRDNAFKDKKEQKSS